MSMQLSTLVDVSQSVGGTRSRLGKRALLRDCLRAATGDEIELVVNYLGGTLPQGRIGLGPAIVRDLRAEPLVAEPGLELAEVDRVFEAIAGMTGKGSQQRRRETLGRLFSRASGEERDFLSRLILGEIRQGALEGILVEGIADAADIPADEIRRAVMLASDPAPVAVAALREGRAGLARFRLEPLAPVRPMLAQPAEDIGDAMSSLGEAALEYKLDGARVQIHRVGRDVRIFSRRLHDVTETGTKLAVSAAGKPLHRRRRGYRAARGRSPAAVPGDDAPLRAQERRRPAGAGAAARYLPLRLPLLRRRRIDRPAVPRTCHPPRIGAGPLRARRPGPRAARGSAPPGR